jgi:ankyrin repeat protein
LDNTITKKLISIIALCFTTHGIAMDTTFRLRDGRTYIHLLAESPTFNFNEMQKIITRPNVNINAQDMHGNTPLHSAVRSDNKDMILFLLKAGAMPNIKNKTGFTPLADALNEHSTDCSLALINNGADTKNLYDPRTRHPLLFSFCGNTPPKTTKIATNIKFFAPVHKALVSIKLIPLYEQQQKKVALFANLILQHYLYVDDDNKDRQEVGYLIIRKLLEVSGLSIV